MKKLTGRLESQDSGAALKLFLTQADREEDGLRSGNPDTVTRG
ncbi:MAG: hypothetical protein ACPLRX_07115 [Candidatus Saccharicenans sp.]